MPPTYLLARDHLQRAAMMLREQDIHSLQLRQIIERTIQLMDETPQRPQRPRNNVLDFETFRALLRNE